MTIPSQLNHYRLLEPLGKGGMGEVFAAEDTRLHRKVAIKVLSGLMAEDPERRHRFEREAQAIAALNHPNIVTIHAVEESQGIPFIVMELVEGQTLADLLRAGGLKLDQLLRIGIGVSDAIGAAHQRGITHRDLKPANVMITPEGRVKVLDFGLAKLREAEANYDGETMLPTGELTGEGRILGTVAYMSPEQAEGKQVDPRSDIFSLGVMLHEMAVGDRPFQGDTNVSIISSILKDTPSSISDINPALPPALARIIRRSLSKDPSRRYQNAIDLRNELEELKQDLDSSAATLTSLRHTAPAASPTTRNWRPLAIGGAVLLVAIAAGAFFLTRRPAPPVQADWVADRVRRLTTTGNAQLAAISPDGRYVVHAKGDGLRPGLWVRQTATASDVQIVAPAAVRYDGLTFTPDGNYVLYVTYDPTGGVASLYKVPVLGGTPQRVIEDIDSSVGFSPDGSRITFMRGVPTEGRNYVMVANADGSDVRRLGTVEAPDQIVLEAPAWSPDGKTILAPARSLKGGPHMLSFAFDAATGAAKVVGDRWLQLQEMKWLPDGHAFLATGVDVSSPQAPQIWQVAFPSGERKRVTVDLSSYAGVSLSKDGSSMATVQAELSADIWIVPLNDPDKAAPITRGRGGAYGINGIGWLKDGRLVYMSSASGNQQLYVMNADGSDARQITSDPGGVSQPSVSADGQLIVYQFFKISGVYISAVAPDGSNARQLTTTGNEVTPAVAPDGKSVFFNQLTGNQTKLVRLAIDGGQTTTLEQTMNPHAVSPDGQFVLGSAWDAAKRRSTLALMPATGGALELLDLPVVNRSSFTPDGKGIGYIDLVGGTSNVWTRAAAGGEPRRLTNFTSDIVFAFAFSPDGQKLAVSRGSQASDVVIISRK